MSLPAPTAVRAIVFDYGNTMIEFGRQQIDHCDGALGAAVRRHFGDFDVARFDAIREAHRMGPYRNGYRENHLPSVTRDVVEALFGRAASDVQVADLVQTRFTAFVECIQAEAATHRVLERLKSRYRLGLLSNYPCGRSIHASLAATGLDRHLAGVVVSGEVGYVKPHPNTYRAILDQLGVDAQQAVFVGDNWLADVQGSKRAGLACVHMRRWVPPERFDPTPTDHQPDAVIEHLDELLDLFDMPRQP
jgi:putative hydrolase of the HAD superfamily